MSQDPRPEQNEKPGDEQVVQALVSSARHELRSPLQSIQGFAELLAAESYGVLGKDQRVFVEHILRSTLDLSRTLDACFDLLQREFLHVPNQPSRVALGDALAAAVTITQRGGGEPMEVELSQVDPELSADLDTLSLRKAISAIVTAISPLLRGQVVLSAIRRADTVELLFAPDRSEGGAAFHSLRELTHQGNPSRALLWLRLACALLEDSARLEATEGFNRIRIIVPTAPST